MSIRKFLAIFTVSVFLIGTLATANAFAGGWKPIVDDHENRIDDLETNDAAQGSRLDTLEQEQEEQNDRLDALEPQPPTMGGIQVFDSSDPPRLVGILASTVPQEISSSPQDLLVQPHITVFVPSPGKFLEMYWSGETITYRTLIPVLYFDGPNCTENAYTDRLSQPPPSGTYFVMDNEYYLYGFKDENQIHTFYTMSGYTGEDPPRILSRQERGQLCEDLFTYPPGYSVAFYALTMVNTNLSFPFQQPLTFE